jgi:DNA-binding XRE family transcriptional regulator
LRETRDQVVLGRSKKAAEVNQVPYELFGRKVLQLVPISLAFWRKKRGKTQSQLAAEVGVSQNFLSNLECGKAKGDVTLYGKFARSLELSIDDLAPQTE